MMPRPATWPNRWLSQLERHHLRAVRRKAYHRGTFDFALPPP